MNTRMFLGVLAAVLCAAGALGVSAAAAAPPEFTPPFPNPFTSTSKAMTLQTVGGFKVKCKADTDKGEITGPVSALVRVTFTGCTSGAARCQGPNGLPGEITTEQLLGTLGYVTRQPKVVGLDLSSPTGGPMIVFFCGEDVRAEVSGSLIGRLTPINKTLAPGELMHLTVTQKEGHQTIRMLLGGPLDVPVTSVLGGPLQESGLASSDLLKFAAPIRIIA